MKRKLTVVGRGTVGCSSILHFLRWTDWEIDWVFDPKIIPTAVGEGTNLLLPAALARNMCFDSVDMLKVQSTPKLGVWKRNWGATGKDFYHPFLSGQTGIHFNAVDLQNYIFDKVRENPRIRAIEQHAVDYENLDSDFVLVCTGSPTENDLTTDFDLHKNIPVNSCIVFQCPWEYPKFHFSVTFAKKYGWVFGIPLTNRCAIGYVHNYQYATEEQIKEDVQDILDEFKLVPARSNSLKFRNYSRKQNFSTKVCFNGNASYFLEPLEATSTGFADYVNRWAYDLWNGNKSLSLVNAAYKGEINAVESMICMHYAAGSIYDNEFWKYAQTLGIEKMDQNFCQKTIFANIVKTAICTDEMYEKTTEVSFWPVPSYRANIAGLGLEKTLKEMIVKYDV